MDMTQTVSNPTATPGVIPGVIPEVIQVGDAGGLALLAMIWIELKPERVQESLAAGGTDAATLSLALAIHQSQAVTFGLAGSGLTITFNSGINGSNNTGGAAPAA